MKSGSHTGEAVVVDETKSKPEVTDEAVKEGQLISIDTEDTEETMPAKTSTPTHPSPTRPPASPGQLEEHGSGAASPMTTSITTGSAHTLEGTQIYENRAYDEGMSISGSEQATDVS